MDTLITMSGIKAEFVTDKHGPIVFLTDTGDDECVGMHPMQLRYIAERFAGLEPQTARTPTVDRSATLAQRLRVLAEHIADLHIALLKSRASDYTDMSFELADAGALLTIARAYTADLPEESTPEPGERAQEAEATTTKAKTSAGPEKATSTPSAVTAGQLGLDV